MKFKYVKDFEFPADRGFRGSNQMPARAGASEREMPARVGKAVGAPRMESMPRVGKAQGYAKGGSAKGKKIAKVMREYKEGKLHSGSKKGPVVKNPKQAMAIALSEAGASKKAMGGEVDYRNAAKLKNKGIFNDEYMAYESKGPKTRGTARKGREQGRRERRAREAMERAEKYAPGLSLDMSEYKKGGKVKHSDVKMDKKLVKSAVHKHERAMHPGKPMTKLKHGGVPSHRRKPMYGGGKC